MALSDEQAPGAPEGTLFTSFSGPVLNNAGQVAFYAKVTGAELSPNDGWGIWSEGGGKLDMVAMPGVQVANAPPGSAFRSMSFTPFALNELGIVSFSDTVFDQGTSEATASGIWTGLNSSTLDLVVRTGDFAPGYNDNTRFVGFSAPVVNRHSDIALWARAQNPYAKPWNYDTGIWKLQGDTVVPIARDGEPAPGTSEVFRDLWHAPTINENGSVAFWMRLSWDESGIWSNANGSLELVVRTDDPAPKLGPGVRFGVQSLPVMNAQGTVLFSSTLQGEEVMPENSYSIWTGRTGQVSLVAREGDQAPGMEPGIVFGEFAPNQPFFFEPIRAFNDVGDVAFVVQLRGDAVTDNDDASIWRAQDSSLELVVREGMNAPGTEPALPFRHLNPPLINADGRIAFRGTVAEILGNGEYHRSGIWAEDVEGTLQAILLQGDLIDIDSGPGLDWRHVQNVSLLEFSGKTEGNQRQAFNKYGQIALKAVLSGGLQAIIVSNRVAIPEPSAGTICGMSILLICSANLRKLRH